MKITPEVAAVEVQKWLDEKKISQKKRTANQDSIDKLVEAVVEGHLKLTEKFFWELKLMFPPVGEDPPKELKFRPRITVGDLQKQTKGISADDPQGIMIAYTAAVTGQPKGVISAIDQDDFLVAQAIVIFFL